MTTPDFSQMTNEEIDAYAQECVSKSGVPDGDWQPLASALRNAAAREQALQDPFWRDAANREATEALDDDGFPPEEDVPVTARHADSDGEL